MRESLAVMLARVDTFNRLHPVGSRVTVTKDRGELFETTVRGEAYLLGGRVGHIPVPVVLVDGISGGYLLDRVVTH